MKHALEEVTAEETYFTIIDTVQRKFYCGKKERCCSNIAKCRTILPFVNADVEFIRVIAPLYLNKADAVIERLASEYVTF